MTRLFILAGVLCAGIVSALRNRAKYLMGSKSLPFQLPSNTSETILSLRQIVLELITETSIIVHPIKGTEILVINDNQKLATLNGLDDVVYAALSLLRIRREIAPYRITTVSCGAYFYNRKLRMWQGGYWPSQSPERSVSPRMMRLIKAVSAYAVANHAKLRQVAWGERSPEECAKELIKEARLD